MNSNVDILNELKELSPLIAGMEKANVFTVPQGYFDGLADHVLNLCKAEELSILNDLSKQEHREVPAGYFDNLADTIMAKIRAGESETAADELRALSPALYSIQGKHVFEVPAGYFDSLADTIIAKVNIDANVTAAEELRTLSPMLYSIQNENVFEVPAGYFAGLADDILNKVKPAKVVTMRKRGYSFMKYAVAAAFTGMMALGVFKFTNTGKTTIDSKDVVAQGQDILKNNKFDQELANVSDADIEKYLQSTGTDVKSAVVANSADESILPSQEDYLLDEQALDKYLNSINVNDLKN